MMSKELKTGIIVILIIIGFIWGFNFLKGHDLLDGKARTFQVEYKKIGDLNKASAVTINGLKVGQVSDIVFDKRKATRGHLIVSFSVENDFEFSKNSVVKIYSPNPLAGSSLAIIPNYDGEPAVSGDTLKGEMEENLITSIGERLDPLQNKLENILGKADTLFTGVNKILNDRTINGINSSVTDLSIILSDLKETVKSVNSLVADNQGNLKTTIKNTKEITENLNKLTDSLTTVDINSIIIKAENAIDNFNELSKKLNSNEGTVGKLLNDEKLYNNIEAATKELEQLLRDLKLNPKRYVHFSLFGKKQKGYVPSLPDSLQIIKE